MTRTNSYLLSIAAAQTSVSRVKKKLYISFNKGCERNALGSGYGNCFSPCMTSTLRMKWVLNLLAIVLTTTILYFGEPVFMPLAIAGVLALVFMPFCRWMERRGVGMVTSSILSGVIFM